MKKIDSYSFNNHGDTMYINVFKDEGDTGTMVASISGCGAMTTQAKDKLAVEVLKQLGYDMRNLNHHLDFEVMYIVALANEIDAVGGSIETALDNFGIYDNPTKEKIKRWFGWEEIPEDEEEDEEEEGDEPDWSDWSDEEFLYSIAQDAKFSKYDYDAMMDDYRNLRIREWLDCLKNELDEGSLAEFKRRFCDDEDEEDEEE